MKALLRNTFIASDDAGVYETIVANGWPCCYSMNAAVYALEIMAARIKIGVLPAEEGIKTQLFQKFNTELAKALLIEPYGMLSRRIEALELFAKRFMTRPITKEEEAEIYSKTPNSIQADVMSRIESLNRFFHVHAHTHANKLRGDSRERQG